MSQLPLHPAPFRGFPPFPPYPDFHLTEQKQGRASLAPRFFRLHLRTGKEEQGSPSPEVDVGDPVMQSGGCLAGHSATEKEGRKGW